MIKKDKNVDPSVVKDKLVSLMTASMAGFIAFFSEQKMSAIDAALKTNCVGVTC